MLIDFKQFQTFLSELDTLIQSKSSFQLRMSNKRSKESDLQQVIVKFIELKKGMHFQFVYRYETKDITKNLLPQLGKETIISLLENSFSQGELKSSNYTYFLTIFPNKKVVLRRKSNQNTMELSATHDHSKNRFIQPDDNIYLQRLGVTTQQFLVKAKMQRKYKQINKYVEIIDDILKRTKISNEPTIVDMGSGKGYLTFALYDYFEKYRTERATIKGIEIRKELVSFCNALSREVKFDRLEFLDTAIQDAQLDAIHVLIALHACDTATDDAIFQGIQHQAELIICAPCCHKQVRKQLNTEGILSEITQYGIFKERQAETLTDTIRALVLQAFGYNTRIFEFISTSHTPKNVLIVADRIEKRRTPKAEVVEKIKQLKATFGLQYQHLEQLTGIY